MLFDRSHLRKYVQEEDNPDHLAPLPPVGTAGACSFLVGRHGVDLSQLIPELQKDHTYFIDSIGHWSLHEMLAYVLHLIGPSDLYISTWGITAEPLKEVLRLLEQGTIRDMHCFFDSRVKTQCPQAYQLLLHAKADRKVRVHLGKNHSKNLVLINETHAVLISASANLTVNHRIESYVVCTWRHIALSKRDVIMLIMDGGQPFEAE
jgi:hypothetical protein